jgi:ribonuclease P protein component
MVENKAQTTEKLKTISHDKIFKIIASRGLKSRNENFLVSRSSFNFLLYNLSNSKKKSDTNTSDTNKEVTIKLDKEVDKTSTNNPFLDSFFAKYNSKSYFFGIKAIKKHFKKANVRNKIKRRIRSIILSYIKTFPIISDKEVISTQNNATPNTHKHISNYNFIVIIPLPKVLTQKFSDLKTNLFDLLNKATPNKFISNNKFMTNKPKFQNSDNHQETSE